MWGLFDKRKIRVAIIDDSLTIRAMAERLIDGDDDFDVCGIAGSADEARVMLRAIDPDVVTLDYRMPGGDGLELLAEIMAHRPLPVVMLSTFTAPGSDLRKRAFALGAAACFEKSGLVREAPRFLALLRRAAIGQRSREAIRLPRLHRDLEFLAAPRPSLANVRA